MARCSVLQQFLPLLAVLTAGCPSERPEPPQRARIRAIIPDGYSDQIRAWLATAPRTATIAEGDVDWVDLPSYRGRDAVFAPSLAARFDDSDPDADVFFIDLYRIGSFRPSWLTPFDEEELRTTVRPAFLNAARLADGKLYGVPWSARGNFLFYRKDLVPEPPRTWQALKDVCAALPGKGLPRAVRYCLLFDWESIQNDLYPLLWSLGGDGELDLASDAVAAFLSDFGEMMGSDVRSGFSLMPSAVLAPEVGKSIHRRFAHGEAVFMINWDNRLRYMQDELGKTGQKVPPTAIAPIPPVKGTLAFSNIGTWGWIVPRASGSASEAATARHDKSVQLVREVCSHEATAFFADRYGAIPARKDAPLPAELKGVLAPEIVAALDAEAPPPTFRFRDRGSDEFVHGFVKDAIRDVLLCRSAVTKPLPSGLIGDCARYFEECVESGDGSGDCMGVAVRRRLAAAQRQILAVQVRGSH